MAALLPAILRQFNVEMTKSSSGFATGYVLYHVTPYFVAGFGLFTFARAIFGGFGLSNDADRDREFETREEFLSRSGVRAGNQPCQPDADSYDEFGESIEMTQR